jgi:hypothetical protein
MREMSKLNKWVKRIECILLFLMPIAGVWLVYEGAYGGLKVEWFPLIIGALCIFFGIESLRAAFWLRKHDKEQERKAKEYREEKEQKTIARLKEAMQMLKGIRCKDCESTSFRIGGSVFFDTAEPSVISGVHLRRAPVKASCRDCDLLVEDESMQDIMFDGVSRVLGLLNKFGTERLKVLSRALESEQEAR